MSRPPVGPSGSRPGSRQDPPPGLALEVPHELSHQVQVPAATGQATGPSEGLDFLDSQRAPAPPPAAAAIFGQLLPLAMAYADLLAGPGVERGLIGPREVPRLWDRHLLNCAVVGELVPQGAAVDDVGSGAGLPGIVLALARPDLTVTLVEPLLRRATFLGEVVDILGLDTVLVDRARAEERARRGAAADVVTARAVAPLDRLAGWCLPLVRPGGLLLAMKGSSAVDELAAHSALLARLGASDSAVVTVGAGVVDPPTTVIRIVAGAAAGSRAGRRRTR